MKYNVTEEQVRQTLLESCGNRAEAARRLKMPASTLKGRLARMTDVFPATDGGNYPILPPGHKVKGVSSLVETVDEETGRKVRQWVKTQEDIKLRENEELAEVVLEALKSDVPKVKAPRKQRRTNLSEELSSLYVLTDYHLGSLSWGEETGEDWDAGIAEGLMLNWFRYAIEHSPEASQAVLCQLGDFLHYDSMETVTPANRNQLDSDTRPQKLIRVAIRVLRQVIDWLLEYHDSVHVIMAEGNHDPVSSAWLREVFALYYEHEPRVTVEIRPDPYYVYVWGDVSLYFHHGHLKKTTNIDSVFVRKFREQYGQTKYTYAHMGHLHHHKAIESTLMIVEQHPTLAAADAFASRGGWMSERVAKVITYHKDYGEVGRICVTPEMLKIDAVR